MVEAAGAGPKPLHRLKLTAESLEAYQGAAESRRDLDLEQEMPLRALTALATIVTERLLTEAPR